MAQIVTMVGSGEGEVTYDGPFGEETFYGFEYTFTATPAQGYRFDHWIYSESENGHQYRSSVNPISLYFSDRHSHNTEAIAYFESIARTVTVSASPQAGGTVSGGGTYNLNESCTVTAIPNSGYRFVNWTENGTAVSTSASYMFTVSSDRNLVANFEELSPKDSSLVTLAVDPIIGGVASGAGYFATGSSHTIIATANNGYVFVNWTNNVDSNTSNNAEHTFTVSQDITWTAHFEYDGEPDPGPTPGPPYPPPSGNGYFQNIHVWVQPNGASGLSEPVHAKVILTVDGYYVERELSSSAYNYNIYLSRNSPHRIEIKIYIYSEYQMWYRAGTWRVQEGIDQPVYDTGDTFTIDLPARDASNVPGYSVEHYLDRYIAVATNPQGGGVCSGGGWVAYGDQCTVSVQPNPKFHFRRWRAEYVIYANDLYETANPCSFYPSDAGVAVAYLSAPLRLTTSSNPENGGTTSGDGFYEYGDTATVSATPNAGYAFDLWKYGTMALNYPSTFNVTVTSDLYFIAFFRRIGVGLLCTDAGIMLCDGQGRLMYAG